MTMEQQLLPGAPRVLTSGAAAVCRVAAAAVLACVAFAVLASTARAEFGLDPAGSGVSLSSTQAGAHADLGVAVDFNRLTPGGLPDDQVRDVRVALPPGFWGSPDAFASCTGVQIGHYNACPAAAQLGTMSIEFHVPSGASFTFNSALYNMVHGTDAVAMFGANIGITPTLKVKLRADDFGLDTVSIALPASDLRIGKVTVTLWGVPADHNGSGVARRPFMTNPSECSNPLDATMTARSWQTPDVFETITEAVPAITGCDRLPPLEPKLVAGPVGGAADAPSGYDVDLTIPQSESPDGIAVPTVKNITVAFPEGVAINPAAGDGLQACTDQQLGVGSDAPPACPDASRVGSVSIVTPALAAPLEGSMYLGTPRAGEPYRLFLVASGSSVMLKLRGVAHADERTGQVTTTFLDTPPLPFSNLRVHLKGGSRALLANPIGCGTFTASASVTPYGGGAASTATSDFTISADGNGASCGAAPAFAPSLAAGMTNPVAGAFSPFTFRLVRDDRHRELGAINSVKLPAGLLGDVSSVPLCTAAQAGAAACPAATRIGSVRVGSGAGATPLYLPGDVYLTGPYKGAPFGLSIVVRAVAGPYDLGTVNVRAAVKVNPDASLTVDADPLPTILQGIPLRLRDILLSFDRPGFMFNPTSCAPATITASAVSIDGLAAPVSNRFQIGGCAALGYQPKLALKLGGREKTGSTSLTARVTPRAGDANSKQIQVKLPDHLGLNVQGSGVPLCSSAQLAARACPADSVVGSASVDSILHEPLSGPVYFVAGPGGKAGALPRLWIPLTGEGVTIDLMAQTTIEDNRIVTTFAPIPDVPFEVFDLKINGGPKGILSLERNWCTKTLTSPVEMDGYNGKLRDGIVVVPAGCAFRAVSRSLTKSRMSVKVSGLGAGTLSIKGAGLRSAKKKITSATVATITAARTRRTAPARVKVTFDPAGPAKAKAIRVAVPKQK